MVTLIAPRKVVATATVSATLARGAHTPVNAASGPLTMTLPTNAAAGVEVSVEKVDSSTNAVTISGTLRGVASNINLTSQYESRTFLSDGTGSWRPISDHRTAASLNATYTSQSDAKKARWDAVVRGTVRDDFSDLTRWGVGTGTPTLSQVTTEPGTPYAMRIVTGAGVAGQFAREFIADMRNKSISFEFKTEDANFDGLRLDLTVDGRSSTRQYARNFILDNRTTTNSSLNIVQGVWKRVVVPASLLSVDTGSPTSIGDVRLMRFTVTPKTGVSASVLMRNLRVHEDPMPSGIVWMFDDSRQNTYDVAWPILAAKGWVGCIPTITGSLGGTVSGVPTMSLAALKEMQAAGWEVVSHTETHTTLQGASLATVQAELRNSYNFLISNGFNAESAKFFVYPGGLWDNQARKEASRHYRMVRTTVDKRQQAAYIADPTIVETAYVGPTTTLAQMTTAADQIANRGGIGLWTFHGLGTGGVADWPTENFQALVDYVANLGFPSYRLRDVYPYDLPETGTP